MKTNSSLRIIRCPAARAISCRLRMRYTRSQSRSAFTGQELAVSSGQLAVSSGQLAVD